MCRVANGKTSGSAVCYGCVTPSVYTELQKSVDVSRIQYIFMTSFIFLASTGESQCSFNPAHHCNSRTAHHRPSFDLSKQAPRARRENAGHSTHPAKAISAKEASRANTPHSSTSGSAPKQAGICASLYVTPTATAAASWRSCVASRTFCAASGPSSRTGTAGSSRGRSGRRM